MVLFQEDIKEKPSAFELTNPFFRNSSGFSFKDIVRFLRILSVLICLNFSNFAFFFLLVNYFIDGF